MAVAFIKDLHKTKQAEFLSQIGRRSVCPTRTRRLLAMMEARGRRVIICESEVNARCFELQKIALYLCKYGQ